jgi:hypothetical protein
MKPEIGAGITVEPHATRRCGEWTACCDGWVRITVKGFEAYPGKPCPYSTGRNCSIYEDRPVYPCRKFICGWLEKNSPLPQEFRPDKIGVIFVIADWRGVPIYVLTPAGRDPDDELLAWTKEWAAREPRPCLYQLGDEWYAYGPTAFQQEMLAKMARGERLW